MRFMAKYHKHRLLKALTKAQKLYNADKYVKAIRLYSRILGMIDEREIRRRVSVYEKIAEMYSQIELYSDAREALSAAVAIEPNLAHLRFSLAVCHMELKESVAAKEQFAVAFWLVADQAAELRRGASYFECNGLTDLAADWTERAEELEGREPWKGK